MIYELFSFRFQSVDTMPGSLLWRVGATQPYGARPEIASATLHGARSRLIHGEPGRGQPVKLRVVLRIRPLAGQATSSDELRKRLTCGVRDCLNSAALGFHKSD